MNKAFWRPTNMALSSLKIIVQYLSVLFFIRGFSEEGVSLCTGKQLVKGLCLEIMDQSHQIASCPDFLWRCLVLQKHKWAKAVGEKGNTGWCRSGCTKEEHGESFWHLKGRRKGGCQEPCRFTTTDKDHKKKKEKDKDSDGMKEWKRKQSWCPETTLSQTRQDKSAKWIICCCLARWFWSCIKNPCPPRFPIGLYSKLLIYLKMLLFSK